MAEINVECLIDGERYTANHLARIEYDRHRHVLHELKRLGAAIGHDGRLLSDDDIDRLTYEDARQVSIATRKAFSLDRIIDLYSAQVHASDEMWKHIVEASTGGPLLAAVTDVVITGMTIDQLRSHEASPDGVGSTYADMNPDHYFLQHGGPGVRVIETFGMYGGPTDTVVTVDLSLSVPVEREPDYVLHTAGYTTLASDGTNVSLLALHQIKALDNAVAIKLGAFFPAATPREVVDGHKVHMAIEFWQMSRLAVNGR